MHGIINKFHQKIWLWKIQICSFCSAAAAHFCWSAGALKIIEKLIQNPFIPTQFALHSRCSLWTLAMPTAHGNSGCSRRTTRKKPTKRSMANFWRVLGAKAGAAACCWPTCSAELVLCCHCRQRGERPGVWHTPRGAGQSGCGVGRSPGKLK